MNEPTKKIQIFCIHLLNRELKTEVEMLKWDTNTLVTNIKRRYIINPCCTSLINLLLRLEKCVNFRAIIIDIHYIIITGHHPF